MFRDQNFKLVDIEMCQKFLIRTLLGRHNDIAMQMTSVTRIPSEKMFMHYFFVLSYEFLTDFFLFAIFVTMVTQNSENSDNQNFGCCFLSLSAVWCPSGLSPRTGAFQILHSSFVLAFSLLG